MRLPSLLAITVGSLPSKTDTQEFVVPKSIPIIFPILFLSFFVVIVQVEFVAPSLASRPLLSNLRAKPVIFFEKNLLPFCHLPGFP